jgi:hypothetical protein
MLPCVLENCAECTYPVSEESSSGLLFLGGNVLGVCMVFGLQGFLSLDPFGPPPFTPNNLAMFREYLACLYVCKEYFLDNCFSHGCEVILASAGAVLLFYNGQYKRMEMEISKERRVSKALDDALYAAGGDLHQVPASLLPSHGHGLLPTVAYSDATAEDDDDDEENANETANLLHR